MMVFALNKRILCLIFTSSESVALKFVKNCFERNNRILKLAEVEGISRLGQFPF